MKTYLFTYLGSLILALVFVPIVRRIAILLNLVDKPDVRRIHAKPTPRTGGIAFVVSTLIAIILVFMVDRAMQNKFLLMQKQIMALLFASLFMFVVGLIDDIKPKGLSTKIKFLALIISSLVVCASGSRIDSISIAGWFSLDLGLFAWLVTILWISGVTVSVNFMDGLDGLATGLSAIACGVIACVAIHFNQPELAIIMTAVLGSLTGFLFFNFNPASIFMGDSGSMFLGVIIGGSIIICTSKASSIIALTLPALALGVPIVDAVCTMIRRGILERRSIFKAERGHIHHRLLDLGLHQKHVVIILYMTSIATATLGLFMLISSEIAAMIMFLCIVLLLVMFFMLAGSVHFRKTIIAIRNNRAIKKELKKHRNSFEEMQLHFREAKALDEWWDVVSLSADKMNFINLSLPVTNHDGSKRILEWKKDGNNVKEHEKITMSIPIHEYRSNKNINLKIDVHKDRSLEIIGSKVALFGRLLDEYGSIPEPETKADSVSERES